jgi:hypothetical protein
MGSLHVYKLGLKKSRYDLLPLTYCLTSDHFSQSPQYPFLILQNPVAIRLTTNFQTVFFVNTGIVH